MKRTLIPAIIITALVSVGLTGLAYSVTMPSTKPFESKTGPVIAEQVYAKSDGEALSANDIMAATNAVRNENKLVPLATNEQLNTAACLKLDDMVKDGYWAHDNPNGTTPWEFFKQAGYNYKAAGENLAYGQMTTPEVMEDWMNSPKHKENLVSDKWLEQGVCVKYVKFQNRDVFLMVHHFGARS